MKFTGIVLAGGKSSRMESDKALITTDGITMLQKSLSALDSFCDEVLIIGATSKYKDFSNNVVEDIYPEKGPLGGIYTGLNHAKNNQCIVLSCDIPNIDEKVIETLIRNYTPGNNLISKCGDQEHPLIGIYSKDHLKTFENALKNNNLKLKISLNNTASKTHTFSNDFDYYFTNINTPEELQEWQEK